MKAKHKQDGRFLYLSSMLRTNLNMVINEKWKKNSAYLAQQMQEV